MKKFRAISGQFPEDLVVYSQNIVEILDPGDYFGTVRFKINSTTHVDEIVPSIEEQCIAAFCDHGFDNLVEPDIIVDRFCTAPDPRILAKSAGNQELRYSYLTPKIARMVLEQYGQEAFEMNRSAQDLVYDWADCADFYRSLNPTLVDLRLPNVASEEPQILSGTLEEETEIIPRDEQVVIMCVHVPGEEEIKQTAE